MTTMFRKILVSAGTAGALLLPAAAFAADKPKIDSGDTAWMLTSTALVLMMTIPGLALFYGGMVRKKNVIATLAQSFVITCLVTVLWAVCAYSLAFTTNPDAKMNAWIGGYSDFFLKGVNMTTPNSLAATIPEYVFMMFQMTFAIITPALIAGSFAERFKFSGLILFMSLWLLAVYTPIAHWVWGGGFLGAGGVLDFAGGTVVHINAGIAGLVTALFLGKRVGYGTDNMAPHNLVLTMIGASLLWVGWFGFNAGSAVASNALAGAAMANTQIATAVAALAWMVVEWFERKKPGMLGLASGAVAGLVAITPASGFVNPQGAMIIGVVAGVGCYLSAVWLKKIFKYDDSLDAFGVHCIGGILGALLTGVLADATINPAGMVHSVVTQAKGVLVTLVWSGVMTLVILLICKFTTGVRVSEEAEIEGLDMSQHGEALHE
ncbi:MAG: ammonium transporter [Caulobacteraceae bacterium]|nr:ammonium transporter [Caulobacteraceae bacterium]